MNTQDAMTLLAQYLKEYTHDFILHEKILVEFQQLLQKDVKSNEDIFFDQLITQLKNIMDYKKEVYRIDSNEILKHLGNDSNGNPYEIYSIHIEKKNKYNVRLLISFDGYNNPLLLTIFNEKGGKRKTDYTEPKKKAKQRKDELTKGDH